MPLTNTDGKCWQIFYFSARMASLKNELARNFKGCQDMTRYGNVWQDMTRYDKKWEGMTRYDKIWQDMTRYDKIWQDMTSYDKIWQDMGKCDLAAFHWQARVEIVRQGGQSSLARMHLKFLLEIIRKVINKNIFSPRFHCRNHNVIVVVGFIVNKN